MDDLENQGDVGCWASKKVPLLDFVNDILTKWLDKGADNIHAGNTSLYDGVYLS